MTATAITKTTTLQLTVNVPVDMELKYIDVWPNDPSKDTKHGKGFGASVALKGDVEGAEVRVYPKGFVNRTIEKLVKFGVVEDGHYQHDPAEKYSIPVKNGNIRIVNALPPGERYANFDILAVNGKPATPVQPTFAAPPKQTTAGKGPVEYVANKPQAEIPPLLRNAEAEDNAELQAKIGIDTSKLQKDLAVYDALTDWYLDTIVPKLTKADVGTTPESVTAGIATLFIKATK